MHAQFVVPRGGVLPAFYDLPWPTDLRRNADGTLMLDDFPSRSTFVQNIARMAGQKTRGWGLNGAIFFRFDGSIDRASLPQTGADSVAPTSSVVLMELDSHRRVPVHALFRDPVSEYWPGHALAIQPVPGFSLRAATTYVAVVFDSVRDTAGRHVLPSDDFAALRDAQTAGDADLAAAATAYEPGLAALGTDRVHAIAVAIFTTQDPVTETCRLRDHLLANVGPAAARDVAYIGNTAGFYQFVGMMDSLPVYQSGTYPYRTEGGEIRFDAAGDPIVQGSVAVRFALALPARQPPAGGWPVVVYAHGTGGDYRSFVDDGTAGLLTARGIAVLGFDQIFNGDRLSPGGNEATDFFNVQNLLAGRDNNRQAFVDLVQIGRFAATLVLASAISPTGAEIRFDATRVALLGHSQGGLNGPLWLACDDLPKGGVLSGAAGGIFIAMVEKTEPVDIPSLVRLVLGAPTEPLDFFHPALTVVQTFIEPAEPLNFGDLVYLDPRPGFRGKSVLITEGLLDEYAPPDGIEALAVAIGTPLVLPGARPVEGLELRGLIGQESPVSQDVSGTGGRVTAGLVQYASGDHFVIFRIADAQRRYGGFLQTLLYGVATIP